MTIIINCSILAALLIVVNGRQMPQDKPKPLVKAPEGSTTTGHHIVVLREDTSKSELHDVMERVKRMSEDVVVHRYTEHVGNTLTVDAPDHVVEKIRHLDEVSHIEEEDIAFGAICEEDSGYKNSTCKNENYLWFLDRLNQLYLPLDNIYTDTFNIQEEETIDVYVLDSGIEVDHAEFENRAKYAGYDPMDEYHFTTANVPDYKPQNGRDCNGHGTLVASLIGGKTYGTAKKVNLFSVRVLDCQLSGATSVILDGLNFVATEVSERNRPAIVSMALRGTIHSSLNTAITTLHNKHILIVGSAGNIHRDACSYFPGSNNLVLRVGAATANDTIYEKSNYGSCVDLFAPGENIRGAEPSCPTCATQGASGTSLASALVCGIAAVHLSRFPLMKPTQLKRKIIDVSAKDVLSSLPSNTPNRLVTFDCGGTFSMQNSTEEVILSSPNFPKHYSNSSRCIWTVHAPEEEYYVYVQFSFIKIEQKYDWLEVCSGKACTKDTRITKLSGDYGETSCGYSSSTNSLTLEFHTDETTTSTGFKAKIMAAEAHTLVKTARTQPQSNDCIQSDKVTALQLDTRSQGASVGNRFSMSKNWEEVFGGRRRGFNIAIIDEVSGDIIKTKNFDAYNANSISVNLAREIEGLHPGALVMMGSSGNAVNHFDSRAKRAIRTLGSYYSYSINSGSSWALVGMKGLAQGRAIEHLDHNAAVHVSTQVKLQSNKQYGLRITVMSSGNYNGAAASFTIDGKEIEIVNDDGSTIGLNVVVFDEKSGKVMETRVFNTHTEVVSDYSPSDAFVDFIDALPTDRVVAIAIRGDAITHLTQEAKRACEKIGSRLITYVHVGRSWAIIGRKGAQPGEVAEMFRYYSQAWATYYLPASSSSNSNISCQISAASSGYWTGCVYNGHIGTSITIGNSTYPSNLCPGNGITIGVVRENSCEFEQTVTYNTNGYYYAHSSLISFINNIADGRIVVATITYDGIQYLFGNGKAALERIGSAHIQNIGTYHAWAIIGRKGAAPGSVPEAYHEYQPYGAAICATVPLKVSTLPSVSSCEDSVYPLNCRAGMSV